MAVEQRSLEVGVCDGCGAEVVSAAGAVYGLRGTVAEVTADRSLGERQFFACRRRCAGKAVAHVLSRGENDIPWSGGQSLSAVVSE
jgi:hypothetical protein